MIAELFSSKTTGRFTANRCSFEMSEHGESVVHATSLDLYSIKIICSRLFSNVFLEEYIRIGL